MAIFSRNPGIVERNPKKTPFFLLQGEKWLKTLEKLAIFARNPKKAPFFRKFRHERPLPVFQQFKQVLYLLHACLMVIHGTYQVNFRDYHVLSWYFNEKLAEKVIKQPFGRKYVQKQKNATNLANNEEVAR